MELVTLGYGGVSNNVTMVANNPGAIEIRIESKLSYSRG